MSPSNTKAKSKHTTTPSQQKSNNSTPSIINFISRKKEGAVIAVQSLTSDSAMAGPQTPQHSAPEKRVYSDNETSCVKRLKLDCTETPSTNLSNKENEKLEKMIVLD
jgi:hypothetical protein